MPSKMKSTPFKPSNRRGAQRAFAAKRSLAIWEKALGPDHPDVAASLENYASLLLATGREAEAQPLLERAQRIRKSAEPRKP